MTLKIVGKKIGDFFSEQKQTFFLFALFVYTLVMMHDDPPIANVSRRWSITLMSLGGGAGHVRGSCRARQAIYIFSDFLCRRVDDVAFVFL